MILVRTNSVEETVSVGYRLGGILRPGDVVCLHGGLGSGKTAFAGGIAKALGIRGHVTSPTFTIINEYPDGRIPLYHFDVYRLGSAEELKELGFEEYLDGGGITVVEWADIVKEALPGEYIHVDMERDQGHEDGSRSIRIDFMGARYAGYERQMQMPENRGKDEYR